MVQGNKITNMGKRMKNTTINVWWK